MKVLIIEDEQHNFNRLKKLLLGYDATMLVEGPLETIDRRAIGFIITRAMRLRISSFLISHILQAVCF